MWRIILVLSLLPMCAQPLLLDPGFPAGEGPDDYVRSVAVQRDQRILVAGNFDGFNGVPSAPLVRLLPNGSLDRDFQPGPFLASGQPSITRVQILSDDRILVHGNFTNAGGQSWTNMALLRPEGSPDSSFSFPAILPRSATFSLQPASDGFWAAGTFTNIGGLRFPRLAKLRMDGAVDPSFHSPFGETSDSVPALLPLPDGRLVISGSFTNLGGVEVRRIARLLPSGLLDPSFAPDLPESFQLSRIVRMPDGSLVGTVSRGDQTILLNEPVTLMRLLPDGRVDTRFAPRFTYPATINGSYNRVLALLPEPDGSLIIAGTFLEIEGRERFGLARLLPDGSLSSCFDPGFGPSAFIISMARQDDGRIVIGGVFRAVEGQNRPYLARLEFQADCGPGHFSFASREFVANEGAPTALITVVRNDSVARPDFVRVETEDGTAHSGEDYDGGIFDLDFAAGERAKTVSLRLRPDAVVEGEETVHLKLSSPSARLAEPVTATLKIADQLEFRAVGQVDPAFRPSLDGSVVAAALTPAGDWLLAVGLTNIAGNVDYTRYTVRQLTSNGVPRETFAGTNLFDGEIQALATLPDGHFLAAGSFAKVNGLDRTGLARFDSPGHLDESFVPFSEYSVPNSYRYPAVSALLVNSDGSIICAGKLPLTPDSPYGFRIFRILADGTLDQEFLKLQERQVSGASALTKLRDGSYGIGCPGEYAAIARVFVSGARDARLIPPPFYAAAVISLATLSDDSLIAGGGSAFALGLVSPALTRLAPNGGKISSFELNGQRSIDLLRSTVTRLRTEPDGRFLAAGTFQIGQSNSLTTVMRFHEDGSWDPSFDAGLGAAPRWSVFQGGSNEITAEIRVLEPFPSGGWLVGGDFAAFDGVSQPFLTRLLPARPGESSFRLTTAQWEIPESTEYLWIDVVRVGSATTNASVRLNTVPTSAAPNLSFTPFDQLLTFLPGEWLKQVAIKITSNDTAETDRTFQVVLSGSSVTSPASATVTILDDDINVEFISGLFNVTEGEPSARIGVRLVGVPERQVSVEIEAGDQSQRIAFPLTQQSNVTNYVQIPIRDDELYVPNQTLPLRLSIVDGEATLGLRSSATLQVIDNDFPESPGRGVTGQINIVAPASNGGIYLAGDFTAVHGVLRQNIARLLNNGEVDRSFEIPRGMDGPITALALQADGGLLIGGDFTMVDGQPRRQLARLFPAGTVDPAFDPEAGPSGISSYPARIFTLMTNSDGSVLAGGRFTSFQGRLAQSIVRLQPDGALDPSFNAPLTRALSFDPRLPSSSSTAPSTVMELHDRPNGGAAVVGDLNLLSRSGVFSQVETATLIGISANGSLDTNFLRQDSRTPISTLCPLPDGRWLAGTIFTRSKFTAFQPSTTNWVAIRRLESDGRLDPSFVIRGAPELSSGSVLRGITLDSQGRILFLAELTGTNGMRFGKTIVARLMPDGFWDNSFRWLGATNSRQTVLVVKFPFNDPLNAVAEFESSASIRSLAVQPDGTLVLGGTFSEINGEPRRRLARVDPGGELRGQLAFTARRAASGLVELRTAAEIETPYRIERSADLIAWQPVRTNSTPWTPLSFYVEPSAANDAHQFFRARTDAAESAD